jgi:Tfp pilus assembly protein PilF
METRVSRFRLGLVVFGIMAAIVAAGCADKERKAVGKLDTPAHHVLRGNDFLDQGRWDQAERSFNLALSLDKEFSPALAGLAVVTAHKASQDGLSEDQIEDLAEKADDLVDDALGKAKNDDQKRVAYIAGIRTKRLSKMPKKSWVEDAADYYEDAVELDERRLDSLPHFYMARVYRDAFNMKKAQDLYSHVLGMNRAKTKEADEELSVVQKIIRAEPGSRHGRIIAFEPSISRADISALFISELKLAQLYTRGNTSRFDTGFKAPTRRQFKADQLKRVPDATDIKEHPLRADIEEVMRLRVLGLQPDPAHLFHPNAKVTRAEFALMVEDILVKVTGETKLKTRFIGQASPFADVRSDLPYFNAVQTVVSRNLMEPKNKIRGIFGPLDPIAGADALLVIRQMKSELQSYLRQS